MLRRCVIRAAATARVPLLAGFVCGMVPRSQPWRGIAVVNGGPFSSMLRVRHSCGLPQVEAAVLDMRLSRRQQTSMRAVGSPEAAQELRRAIDGLVAAKISHGTATLTTYTLPGGLTWPGVDSSELVVRTAVFDPIWDTVKDQHSKEATVIIGNPGIGKSTMLNYFLLRALQSRSHDHVVLDVPGKGFTYFFNVKDPSQDTRLRDEAERQTKSTELRECRNVLRLQDVGGGHTWVKWFDAVTVVAASPNEGNYKENVKQFKASKLFVPTWTLDELQAGREAMRGELPLSADDVARRFEQIGGVPRYVFGTQKTYDDYWEDVLAAIETFDFAQMKTAMQQDTCNSHKIMQLVPRDKSFWHTFLSRRIEDEWATAQMRNRSAGVTTHLLQNLPIASKRLQLGSLFEQHLVKFALQDRAWYIAIRDTVTLLGPHAAGTPLSFNPLPDPAALPNERLKVELVDTGRKVVPVAHTCYVPQQPNYPLCDALVFGPADTRTGSVAWVTAIQSTLANDHPTTTTAVDAFVQRVKMQFGVDVTAGVPLHVVFVRDWTKPAADFKVQRIDEEKHPSPSAAALWGRAQQYHAHAKEELFTA